ncbi:hypothetical protein QS306_00680 [Paraburkholderia bonniea]|uniref:hypothetical protein n=1 Tax=Paraburkholderia bonniea TaxID=2152891 RepID=UPI001290F990|nr:hypothetical protein [Paraburkholderia bonniea]WJF90238.1 hypothetical protein QS306_00680 [Paraburkholderia bonniea]WJF93552.1 hypothetical protein QS308_00680 [Paraburkholderia bonniea]
MKKLSLALSASFIFGLTLSGAATAGIKPTIYSCSGGSYSAQVYPLDDYHVALIDGAGNSAVLLSAETGSGELYKSDTFELESKGNSAIITAIDDGKRYEHKGCKVKR